MSSTAISPSIEAPADAAQYLTFSLGSVTYAVPVEHAQTVLEQPKITPIPRMPAGVRGVLDFRGKTIPAIDLARVLFTDRSRPRQEDTDGITTVIVMEVDRRGEPFVFATIVDQVHQVIQITSDHLTTVSDAQYGVDSAAVSRIARVDEEMIVILAVDSIVSG
ncbi:MAG: chemotaxis protein CheW [Alkalispirochaeta sp.]